VTLNYRLDGDGDRVLVLAGSIGTTLDVWEPQLPALSPSRRVLRYDHPGHGESPASGARTMADLSAQVLELLDELGLERVSFCGLSLGGAVGMRAALDAPERFERLALLSTSARFRTPQYWDDRATTVRREGLHAIADGVLDIWFTPQWKNLRTYRDMLTSTSREGYADCCEALRDWDAAGTLGAVRAPTLVVAAAEDSAAPPSDLERIASEIPGARLEVIDGARHLVNVEQSDVVNGLLLDHLAA
jgi:3-oxoadipate enol-lactonase